MYKHVINTACSLLLLVTFGEARAQAVTAAVSESRGREALQFCRKKRLDTTTAFMVDFGVHSGKKRFYIYDLQKKKVTGSSLCCHGMGMGSSGDKPVYSNECGSNCSSLGKYRTGERAYSSYGINIHYKLHGLEKSNNNAFKRIVVLHSYDPVSEEEIFPGHLPMGWSLGCPVVSNNMMRKIDGILKSRKREVLLWMYE